MHVHKINANSKSIDFNFFKISEPRTVVFVGARVFALCSNARQKRQRSK
jgi:hypothetical protein